MLESITVKNLALIRESEITLTPGLNILTGETGAGKSIILGSIRLALGERATKDVIRQGAEYASIELVFTSKDEAVANKMRQLDIPTEPDGSIYINRRIMESRSVAKCNGEPITGKALRELASMLINIHGQNDTQTLLDAKNYREILDRFIYDTKSNEFAHMSSAYREYSSTLSELREADNIDDNREKDVELATFEVQEIENARLSLGEDEQLEEKYNLMKNSVRIVEALGKAVGALDIDNGTGAGIGVALRELNGVAGYDDSINELIGELNTAEDIIRESLRSMNDYVTSLDFDDMEYRQVEERLNVINHLKDRYGDSVEAILQYATERKQYIEKMADYDAYLEKLRAKEAAAKKAALEAAHKLSDIRRDGAKMLEKRLIANLQSLNFQNVDFKIDVISDDEQLGVNGVDDIRFLVSFNVGEPLRSLNEVASGGELSRFMLALKALTADADSVETLIFDEIDAGISGKTAWSVSEKMSSIAKESQVIAITHLAQIAAMADTHFVIEKNVVDDSTVTQIARLDATGHMNEIARLLSGGELTDVSTANAKELIEQALSKK
ncbi:MAG: DNA repair protein RecN [Lachnospiraceae bacterium]|nr:DNA repair protein RecN [Candidatus Colinaster equi]